ncbi:hypothetical protein LSAT2_000328 [Lamellibrachia satsuma]|nr:hypothetical protein LSAT2_000328 [Lamellibrachia satsuma]
MDKRNKQVHSACMVCNQTVRSRQEHLLCDGCTRWQHRTCDKTITRADYLTILKSQKHIAWLCTDCRSPRDVELDHSRSALTGSTDRYNSRSKVNVADESSSSDSSSNKEAVTTQPDLNVTSDSSTQDSSDDDHRMDITYKVFRTGNTKGRPALQSSTGYVYNTGKIEAVTFWWCSVKTCRASVLQRGDSFTAGWAKHSHPAKARRLVNGKERCSRSIASVSGSGDATGETSSSESTDNEATATTPTCSKIITNKSDSCETSSGEEKPAISQPQDVTYELFERGTSRGFPLLLSSDGHSYVVKKRLKPTTYWRCSVRYEGKQCPAGVSQQGETFTAGHFNHSHPSEPTRLIMAKVACQIKEAAIARSSEAAANIVNDILLQTPDHESISVQQQANLIRTANRFRQQQKSNQ